MKTYEKPEIEVTDFEITDVITTSSTEIGGGNDSEHDNSYGDITDFLKRKP